MPDLEPTANDPRPLADLAARQHGLVSRRQCRKHGLTPGACVHLVKSGRWRALNHGVLQAAGAPTTERSRAMAAVLASGDTARLSHTSAAALWGLPGYFVDPLHVTVLRREHRVPSSLASVHRQRSLAMVPPSTIDGIPVVRLEVLVLQLCGCVHPRRAERALDRAWADRLLSGRSIRRVLARIDTQGLRGVAVLRELLAVRGDGYTPPATGLELRLVQVLREAGLPELSRQVDLGDDAHWCGRVDFFDRALGVVLEVDSERFHTALLDVEHDRRRARELARAGFIVGSVTDVQVWHRPGEVVDTVRELRARAQHRRKSA